MTLFVIIDLFLLFLFTSPLIVGAILLWKRRVRTGGIVLGLYFALIATFVIYGNLERRSAVGHIVRWWEGEYGNKQNVNDFAEDAKKVIDPTKLQEWAIAVLHETETTNYSPDDFPRDKVLPSIQNLQSGGDSFEDVEVDDANSARPGGRSVWIWWGGPFGHWGLRIGSPSFKPTDPYDDNYYVVWKPGIYFWCQTH